jgi:hypothetical protein
LRTWRAASDEEVDEELGEAEETEEVDEDMEETGEEEEVEEEKAPEPVRQCV